MFGRELLVSLALRERLGRLDETAAAVGIFLEIHIPSLGLFRTPVTSATGTSSLGLQGGAGRFRDLGQTPKSQGVPTPLTDAKNGHLLSVIWGHGDKGVRTDAALHLRSRNCVYDAAPSTRTSCGPPPPQ